jgi:hypothetical protein
MSVAEFFGSIVALITSALRVFELIKTQCVVLMITFVEYGHIVFYAGETFRFWKAADNERPQASIFRPQFFCGELPGWRLAPTG